MIQAAIVIVIDIQTHRKFVDLPVYFHSSLLIILECSRKKKFSFIPILCLVKREVNTFAIIYNHIGLSINRYLCMDYFYLSLLIIFSLSNENTKKKNPTIFLKIINFLQLSIKKKNHRIHHTKITKSKYPETIGHFLKQ